MTDWGGHGGILGFWTNSEWDQAAIYIYISKRFKVSVHQKVALFGAIISVKFQKMWMGFRFFNVSCLLWGQMQYFPFSMSYKETWDERLASESPLPCLPRTIVLNLGKKKFTGGEIVLALEIKTASAAWLRRASGSWGKLFLSYPWPFSVSWSPFYLITYAIWFKVITIRYSLFQ